MINPSGPGPDSGQLARVYFEIKERHGIWSVKRDDVFYGDFITEADAEAAADAAVTSVIAQGGRAVKTFAIS